MGDDLIPAAREAVEMLRARDCWRGDCSLEEPCDGCAEADTLAARLERAIEVESAPRCCASCFQDDPRNRSAGCAVRRAYQAVFSRTWTASDFWCAMWFPRSKSDDK